MNILLQNLRITLPVFFHVIAMAFSILMLPRPGYSINIDEAISLAERNLPSYKAAKLEVQSTENLYKASLSPYLPSLDTSTSQEYHDTTPEDFDLNTYDVTLSYLLFDGGRRKANRNIAELNLDITRQEQDKNLLDLEFNVKSSFYTAIARKEILEQRKIQLEDARKDHEVAQGRYKFGVAKLSDVLQASVRLEQARFKLVQAEGELAIGLANLNSLLGRDLNMVYDLDGRLSFEMAAPHLDLLSQAALKRPEIKQAEDLLKISKQNKSLEISAFFPDITANTSYSRADADRAIDDRSVGIKATWNIFELGKFYRTKSAQLEIHVSEENINETIRQLLLDVKRAYEDFLTASKNISVAQEQLAQAEQNYSQAFGEYKVGKGDILSLVQAESFLSTAREQLTTSKLNHILAKSLLERIAGIDKLESFQY
ncbi:TolC family protein [Desulforhabdus amnigena]|uniref:Agglutination protein n=1 Tax=Desulforhabdus amnigena TaxID=40218 RepID=A0A9W6D1X7_9BACT|nr:TolC family protein [Desulforhabdus amnigena]NLJ29366.1 TolC family protein [Deltaproteobacteria bacterium]GLI34365.1 agglutination protein [Desulforhabdus amnigena]